MYDEGDGVPQDFEEAAKWYRKAAEQGNAKAQCSLGLMYASGTYTDGKVVEVNDVKAYAWFNLAVANGYGVAKRVKDAFTPEMTPEQIAKGEELSKEMLKKNPKLVK